MLKDRREGRPEEPGGRGLNKGSNLESISKTFGGRLLLCCIILTGCGTCCWLTGLFDLVQTPLARSSKAVFMT